MLCVASDFGAISWPLERHWKLEGSAAAYAPFPDSATSVLATRLMRAMTRIRRIALVFIMDAPDLRW